VAHESTKCEQTPPNSISNECFNSQYVQYGGRTGDYNSDSQLYPRAHGYGLLQGVNLAKCGFLFARSVDKNCMMANATSSPWPRCRVETCASVLLDLSLCETISVINSFQGIRPIFSLFAANLLSAYSFGQGINAPDQKRARILA
jgi:hypothetical protein